MMGVGFASAIFIDAFIIRLLLLPAVMHIVGPAMWWMPSWLERRLPHLHIEAEEGPAEVPPAEPEREEIPT
jgi:RND superfamily putative drug exporter